MASGFSIGYVNFTVFIMLLVGILNLRIDVKVYRAGNQKREEKTSRFMGWFNIAAAAATYLSYWAYQSFMW